MVAGYTDISGGAGSSMGLSVRAPTGTWTDYPALSPEDNAFRPSGDGWLAAAKEGGRVYYVSLLETTRRVTALDDSGDGLALAIVDVRNGSTRIVPPRRIDRGRWPSWDEPTVSATRLPDASADTVIVAATPVGADLRDVIAVLVSHDGGTSFHEVLPLHAPDYPGHVAHGPNNTVLRPLLAQDPRAGQECHAYLAFGVYSGTALASTPGISPPDCQAATGGCRSIAESETRDCGESWGAPRFIAIDTGSTGSDDFRGFSYAVAVDGSRHVLFTDDTADDTPVLLKRAAPDANFAVVANGRWDDVQVERIASEPGSSAQSVERWAPTLAASGNLVATWVEQDVASGQTMLRVTSSALAAPTWTPARRVESAGVACGDGAYASDDYFALAPEGALGATASRFVVAWAPFATCGSSAPRRVRFDVVN
jgi:hypothetical protein